MAEFANFQSTEIISSGSKLMNKSSVSFPLSISQANLTRSSTALASKSVLKLEEKFKKYVSEADLLFRSLSKFSVHNIPTMDLCDSAHLLDRNTESFRCLAQLQLSNSSLMKNRLFLFPPLEDPGIDVAFNFKEPLPENDDIGIEKYKKICKEMEIVPISRIMFSLETDTVDLKYYGLTCKQIKALTEAMKANARVQELILQDNWLTVEMTQMVSDMVVENTSLQTLSLRECRIGPEGAQKLGEVMSSLQSLRSLDLSYNDLGDIGLASLRDGLCQNMSLKILNLSHNNLTDESGETIEKILLENKHLEELDLSWSGFNTAQANKKLFSGFTNSDRIKYLNLAWNGIEDIMAVRPITRYLTKSKNLEELDISNNRLVGPPLRAIRGAISKNHSLQIVKIGNNIYTTEDAHLLLTALAGKAKDPLHVLDMENMYIKKESKTILNKIKNLGKTVKIGGILSNYEIHGPNPRKLIYERCRYILMKPKRAKARKDFGHFILSLPETPMTADEFEKEIKKQKIKKLDHDLVKGLMDLFLNKKREVECSELKKDYMTFYPETQLPPPKLKKAKGKGKGKKGKVTEEKVLEVHDLETQPSQAEVSPDLGNEIISPSKVVLAVSPSKTMHRSSQSQSQGHIEPRKSVSIIPQPSFLTEVPAKLIPEAEAAPKKSIMKIRESKVPDYPLESKTDSLSKRASVRSRGSRVQMQSESQPA